MELDLNKIEDIYGTSVIIEIQDNIDSVINNLKYLVSINISDVYEVINNYPFLFIEDNDIFKEKIDTFINELGINYRELLANDMSLWGDLL